jgi:hypothetical protein
VIRSIVLFLLIAAAAPALATTTFTFSTSDSPFDPGLDNQGWYPSPGAILAGGDTDNYILGTRPSATFRNFFTFDLTALPADAQVLSATLRLTRFGSSETNEEVETIEFFDVTTDPATLNDNPGPNSAIYADLGSGISYGAFQVAKEPGLLFSFSTLEFSLDAAALADIELAAGSSSLPASSSRSGGRSSATTATTICSGSATRSRAGLGSRSW